VKQGDLLRHLRKYGCHLKREGAWRLGRLASTEMSMRRVLPVAVVLLLAAGPAAPQSPEDHILARAKALELNTPYVPPPGDALEHHASGFAKIMCSAVFITGLDPDFAAENVWVFTGPYGERGKLGVSRLEFGSGAVAMRYEPRR